MHEREHEDARMSVSMSTSHSLSSISTTAIRSRSLQSRRLGDDEGCACDSGDEGGSDGAGERRDDVGLKGSVGMSGACCVASVGPSAEASLLSLSTQRNALPLRLRRPQSSSVESALDSSGSKGRSESEGSKEAGADPIACVHMCAAQQ